MTYSRMGYQMHTTTWQLERVRYPKLKHIPLSWPDLVDHLEQLKPTLFYKKINWNAGVIKCNTNGACRGNPGRSSYG